MNQITREIFKGKQIVLGYLITLIVYMKIIVSNYK